MASTGGAGGAPGTGGSGGASGTGGVSVDAGGGGVVSFPYAPNHFDAPTYQGTVPGSAIVALGCGESTFDSTTLTFGNWCGQFQPAPVALPQAGGPDVVVLPVAGLAIARGASLKVSGGRPVIVAVYGDATVAGTVDVDASGIMPGAGGNVSCGNSQGKDGAGDPARNNGASGGGGGGFVTAGGSGGLCNTDGCCGGNVPRNTAGGAGGVARTTTAPAPLLGGCAGGKAGACATAGGAGGGAIQISAAGTLTVSGTVRANGAAGTLPCGANDEGGGTGGGSGGEILLEGSTLATTGATLQASGGAGGPDGAYFHCADGPSGSSSASRAGSNAQNCSGGSPGGGGGYGHVQTLDR
jgi:hypothetical protein